MSIVRRVRRDGTVGYQVRVSVAGRRLPARTFDIRRDARRYEAELVSKRRWATTDETCDSFAIRWPDVRGRKNRPDTGPHMRAMILFTGYAGNRLEEGWALEWSWLDFDRSEVTFKVAKFDRPRTVLLLDEAAEARRSVPRDTSRDPAPVFRSIRGKPIRYRSTHYWAWNPVRAAFWATVAAERRQAIVISTGTRCATSAAGTSKAFSDELVAYQLGHSDAELIRDLYGHGRADALERLKRGRASRCGRSVPPHCHMPPGRRMNTGGSPQVLPFAPT